MKYAMLVYSRPGLYEGLDEEERRTASGQFLALAEDPRCLEEAQLQSVETATTVRVQDGRTLATDGPFADTKEFFGGYYVFEAGDLDEAIEIASRIPTSRIGGAVEVRPVVERER